jgi:hypothetical protein
MMLPPPASSPPRGPLSVDGGMGPRNNDAEVMQTNNDAAVSRLCVVPRAVFAFGSALSASRLTSDIGVQVGGGRGVPA